MWRTMRSQEGSNARMKDKRQTGCHEGWDGMFSQVSNQLNRFKGINTKSCRRWMSFYSWMRIDNKQYKETEAVGGRVSWLQSLSLMMTPGERLFYHCSRDDLSPSCVKRNLVCVSLHNLWSLSLTILPYLVQLSCCWFSVSCCFGWSASGKSLLLLPPEAKDSQWIRNMEKEETAQTTDRSNNFILDFSAQTVLSPADTYSCSICIWRQRSDTGFCSASSLLLSQETVFEANGDDDCEEYYESKLLLCCPLLTDVQFLSFSITSDRY